jgi:hypothetical protein
MDPSPELAAGPALDAKIAEWMGCHPVSVGGALFTCGCGEPRNSTIMLDHTHERLVT